MKNVIRIEDLNAGNIFKKDGIEYEFVELVYTEQGDPYAIETTEGYIYEMCYGNRVVLDTEEEVELVERNIKREPTTNDKRLRVYIEDIIQAFGDDNHFGEAEIVGILSEISSEIGILPFDATPISVHNVMLAMEKEGLVKNVSGYTTIWISECSRVLN